MRVSELYQTPTVYGDHESPLISLVDDWAARVLKFRLDIVSAETVRLPWGVDDLIGAYILRDAIERGLQIGNYGQDKFLTPATLTVTDELLRSITVEDEQSLRLISPKDPTSSWWWSRIPTAGPVREEVLEIRAALGHSN